MMENPECRLPQDFIPIDELPTEWLKIAVWYLRVKMLQSGNPVAKHICCRCGSDLHFAGGDVKGDSYHEYVVAFCEKCRVKSDNHVYHKYDCGVVAFAEGALQDAINDVEEKVIKL